MRVQHLVQTRFSVRVFWGHQGGFPRDWLETRLALFEDYCLASMAAQTAEDFTWLVYCDHATDPAVMARLRALERGIPQLRIALTRREMIGLATRPYVDPSCDVLITTRLDSDDGVHTGYVEAIQAHAEAFMRAGHATWLLNFPRGFQLDHRTGELYFAWSPASAFHSLFEREPAGTRTVLHGSHLTMHRWHPVAQDDSLAAWLMVIHGGNVANRLVEDAQPAPVERLARFGRPAAYAGTASRSER